MYWNPTCKFCLILNLLPNHSTPQLRALSAISFASTLFAGFESCLVPRWINSKFGPKLHLSFILPLFAWFKINSIFPKNHVLLTPPLSAPKSKINSTRSTPPTKHPKLGLAATHYQSSLCLLPLTHLFGSKWKIARGHSISTLLSTSIEQGHKSIPNSCSISVHIN